MGYLLDYRQNKNFVNLKVEGRLNFKLAEKYSVEALKLAHQNNCHKFLINHIDTKLEYAGIYKLHTDGAALERFGFKCIDKIAIVISRVKDDRLFFEKAEQDANWSNYKYFGTVEEALNWLDAEN
jgi:hypothetical protein